MASSERNRWRASTAPPCWAAGVASSADSTRSVTRAVSWLFSSGPTADGVYDTVRDVGV